MAFDAYAARDEFPILRRTIAGRPLVYLDSAASAQKPRAVIEAMTRCMETSYANVHRGLHTLANEATEAFEAAREAVAGFLNAGVDEIVFTKGATEAINLVAQSLGARFGPGDEIVLTEMEHHANIVPWWMLAQSRGVVLRWAPIRDDGVLDYEAFLELLGPRTRLVAVSHMSNVLGTLNPVRAITEAAQAAGALVLLDGCQAAVHARVDVKAIGCDFFVFSGHKLYGPTGIGALYGRRELLADMPPWQGGGEMIAEVTKERVLFADPPHRFEAGTPAIVEAVGLKAAIDWLSAFDRDAVHAHEKALYDRAVSALEGANWFRPIGTAPDKGAILAFTMADAHAHDVAQILDRYGVAVRAGQHCAEPLMRRLGVHSTARASFALYNTPEDVDAFTEALTKARSFFS